MLIAAFLVYNRSNVRVGGRSVHCSHFGGPAGLACGLVHKSKEVFFVEAPATGNVESSSLLWSAVKMGEKGGQTMNMNIAVNVDSPVEGESPDLCLVSGSSDFDLYEWALEFSAAAGFEVERVRPKRPH